MSLLTDDSDFVPTIPESVFPSSSSRSDLVMCAIDGLHSPQFSSFPQGWLNYIPAYVTIGYMSSRTFLVSFI